MSAIDSGTGNVFDFTLTEAELAEINALNEDPRYGSDPDDFNF